VIHDLTIPEYCAAPVALRDSRPRVSSGAQSFTTKPDPEPDPELKDRRSCRRPLRAHSTPATR
jgi:hypothetical protein